MITAIPREEIQKIVCKQLDNFFLINKEEEAQILFVWQRVMDRVEKCFRPSPNKYYSRDGETYFNPFHSGQYCIFLYFLSNEIWKAGNSLLADKIYYLNKALNGCDMFYEVALPEFFMLDHPVGSVLGRAQYADGFTFGQGCTVGNNNGIYPILGNNVVLCANASIIGACHVGSNVTIGAYACVKDQDVPDNSVVFGQSPNLVIKKKNS